MVAPAGITMEGGALTYVGLPIDMLTVQPPSGAGFDSVTVAVLVPPPPIVDGDNTSEMILGFLIVTVKPAVALTLPDVAVITSEIFPVTGWVARLNVAVEEPAGTVTKGGTTAEGSLLFSATMSPPKGAGEDKVTVPVAVLPPTTEVGEMVKL